VLPGWEGPAYGIPGESTLEAIRLAGRLEGVITDPVYEGKSMAALIDLVRDGTIPAGSNVLFAHLGGQPGYPPTPGSSAPNSASGPCPRDFRRMRLVKLAGRLTNVAELLGIFAVFGFFAAVAAGLYVVGARLRARGRGAGASFVGPFEEIWHPAAHRARLTIEARKEQGDPAPAPADPPRSD